MFTSENLDFYYSVRAPVGGGTTEMKLTMNYPESTNVHSYIINEDKINGLNEILSVYDTGLVTYTKNSSTLVELRTNKEFLMQDDGSFKIVD